MRHLISAVTILALTMSGPVALAQDQQPIATGGALIPVQDGSAHSCIDVSTHSVSMRLAAAQVSRTRSWWDELLHQDRALGVKFDVIITDHGAHTFQFPRAKQLAAPRRATDIALLPMQFPIMSKYRLVGEDGQSFQNVNLDLTFITVEEHSDAARLLTTVTDFTQTLPLPPNPYSVGVDYFGRFVNTLVDSNIRHGAGADPDASFSFDLAANAAQAQACPTGALREGVQAVVFDFDGTPTQNMIRISDSGDYCLWFNGQTTRIRFQRRASREAQCAATAPTTARDLDNPLIAFSVQSWSLAPADTQQRPPVSSLLSQFRPVIVAQSLDANDVDTFVQAAGNDVSTQALRQVEPATVARLLELTNRRQINQAALTNALSGASLADVETALALRRCAILGVEAQQCEGAAS